MCGCNNRCPSCYTIQTIPCTTERCHKTLGMDDLGTLVYLAGLDERFCEKFQRISDILQLRDCAGNPISINTPIVTCAAFRERLIIALGQLDFEGAGVPGVTTFVSSDGNVYTLPASGSPGTETPNTATDTPTIDMSASGTLGRNISGNVKISLSGGNNISINGDGLYVPTPSTPLTACQQIQAFATGSDAVDGTVLIGSDCQKHTLRFPDPITVIDTSSINMTFLANALSAVLNLDPTSIGRITGSGLQILCSDILTCAPPVTVSDTQTVNLTITGQALTADVLISSVPGNDLSVNASGLYVSICDKLSGLPVTGDIEFGVTQLVGADCTLYTVPEAPGFTIADTTTVDLDLDGGPTLRANVNIVPGTLLTTGPQGLQVTCEAVQDCIFTTDNNFWEYDDTLNRVTFNPSDDAGNQITVGSDNRPFVPATPFNVESSDCIQLSFVDDTLTAVPIISPESGNVLVCNSEGLFVQGVDVTVSAGDLNDCIQISVDEPTPGNYEINALPVISPDLGNSLECRANGLFSSAEAVPIVITGEDSDCIDITITEDPDNTFTISAVPIISPDEDNIIECRENGLFVDPAVEVNGVSTDCITVGVTEFPPNNFEVEAQIILDPDAENAIECRVAGLFAPLTQGDTDTISIAAPLTGATILAGDAASPILVGNLAVTNPSATRPALLTVNIEHPQTTVLGSPTGDWQLRVDLVRQVNFPGVLVVAVPTVYKSDLLTGVTGQQHGHVNGNGVYMFLVPAGFTGNWIYTVNVNNIGVTDLDDVNVGPLSISYTIITI